MSPLSHGELVQMETAAKNKTAPIVVDYDTIYKEVRNDFDEKIMQAVLNVGITVNKPELIRALELDKELREGKLVEVTRCEHCQHAEEQLDGRYCCYLHDAVFEADYFCKDGEEAPNVSP